MTCHHTTTTTTQAPVTTTTVKPCHTTTTEAKSVTSTTVAHTTTTVAPTTTTIHRTTSTTAKLDDTSGRVEQTQYAGTPEIAQPVVLTVHTTPAPSQELAHTGLPVGPFLVIGVFFVVVGTALIRMTRKAETNKKAWRKRSLLQAEQAVPIARQWAQERDQEALFNKTIADRQAAIESEVK